MATKTVKKSAVTKATPAKKAAGKPRPAAKPTKPSAGKRAGSGRATAVAAVDRTTELSQDVLTSLESAQRAALEAVRTFVETVDDALPALGERPSRREKVIDAALEMADRLVSTQYEFLRTTVASAGRSVKHAVPDEN